MRWVLPLTPLLQETDEKRLTPQESIQNWRIQVKTKDPCWIQESEDMNLSAASFPTWPWSGLSSGENRLRVHVQLSLSTEGCWPQRSHMVAWNKNRTAGVSVKKACFCLVTASLEVISPARRVSRLFHGRLGHHFSLHVLKVSLSLWVKERTASWEFCEVESYIFFIGRSLLHQPYLLEREPENVIFFSYMD